MLKHFRFCLFLTGFAVSAQSTLRVEDLERMALDRNPAVAAANATVRAAEGRRVQAGLYPNPTIGYTADEVAPSQTFNYGEHGAFVEQRFLTGGKRDAARSVADQELAQARANAEAERMRVRNQVRQLFYQALGEQKLLQVREQLAKLAARAVQTTSELANVGQADRPDVLAVEVEAQRLELGLQTSRNALDRTWRQLAAATSNADLRRVPLEGDLEQIPRLEFEGALARALEQSPELRSVEAGIQRSESAVRAARAAAIPDVFARAGIHYNRELLERNNRPVGWQGSVEIGVALPLFNRNQGNISAARAEAERARSEVERTRLQLKSRLAGVYQEYQDAIAAIDRYRTEMIPKAQRAYDLYQTSFRKMAAAYPQALIAQRNLFQLQEDYVTTLIRAWQRSVEIEGLLLRAGEEPMGFRTPATENE